LIGVVVVFPDCTEEELRIGGVAMAVIIEEEIEPTIKIMEIAINNKRHLLEIIFFTFSWNYIKQTLWKIF